MKRYFEITAIALILLVACAPRTTIVWNEADVPKVLLDVTDDGVRTQGISYKERGTYELQVVNPPKDLDWEIWGYFEFRDRGPMIVPTFTDDLSWERFDGKNCVLRPKVIKDTLTLKYSWGRLPGYGWAPANFTLVTSKGKKIPIDVKYNFVPEEPEEVRTYEKKELLPFDMIPRLKRVEYNEGTTVVPDNYEVNRVEGKCDGWYRIVADGTLNVEAADYSGEFYARNTIGRIASDGTIPNGVIEDWPDVKFRVMMLDLSSMFYPVEDLKTIIDIMSRYRMNILHLHLTDDSGWRIAIDGLPELTEYGAVHKIPVRTGDGSYDERDGLVTTREGNPSRDGFYTHEDFVDILRYAAMHAITIIPEVDMPAHAKASVRAMEIRARRAGDTTYLLTDPDDQSRTISIQGYKRNTMNVTMPSVYRFIEKVVDQFSEMFREAGIEMKYFHIGGDEVPDGVWMGSPIAQKFMAETGMKTKSDLRGYFIMRMLDILKERGIKACGWSSMTYNVSDEVRWRVRDEVAYLNCGQSVGDPKLEGKLYGLANDGIHCCVNCCGNSYWANAYSSSKYENGFYYAGYLDERRAFELMPFRLFEDDRYVLECPESIVGIGSLMWHSVQKDVRMSFECMYPKALGNYERAWNARPEGDYRSFDKFYSIVADREVPWFDSKGIPHRVVLCPCSP